MSANNRWHRLLERLVGKAPSATEGHVSETGSDLEAESPARADGEDADGARTAPETPAPSPARELRELLTRLTGSAAQGDSNSRSDEETLRLVDQILADDDTGEAVTQITPFVAKPGAYPQLELRLATALYDRGRHTEAIALFERLAEMPETEIDGHLALADHLRQQADFPAALRHYEEVLARDFGHTRARVRADRLRDQMRQPSFSGAPTIVGGNEAGTHRRFVIQRELGGGGGGRVYLARDRQLDRPVALKVLHQRVARHGQLRAQLFCEARLAASLRHPQIITVYDLDEQFALIAMEYCAGGTLGQFIGRDTGPLQPAEALHRLAEMCHVLELVHRAGIVHRDIKPANWLLRRPVATAATVSPDLVLSDFGSAGAAIGPEDPQAARGTLAYIAPEQLAGSTVGPQSDLYACGLIAVELILGHRLTSVVELGRGVDLIDQDPVWSALRARIPLDAHPESLVGFLRALVHPNPAKRLAEAGVCAARAAEFALGCERASEHQALVDDLRRLAGPEPRPPEVNRWLQRQIGSGA